MEVETKHEGENGRGRGSGCSYRRGEGDADFRQPEDKQSKILVNATAELILNRISIHGEFKVCSRPVNAFH